MHQKIIFYPIFINKNICHTNFIFSAVFNICSNVLSDASRYRKCNRGRKKKELYPADNMYETLRIHVLPKWIKYLQFKSNKVNTSSWAGVRHDAVWKRLIRDVREFFRILFRVRFHYLDFKDQVGAYKCVELMFTELGISIPVKYQFDPHLFTFIHQSHKLTAKKMFKNSQNSVFDVLERFNLRNCKSFLKDGLASKLIYFIFQNFHDEFVRTLDKKYATSIVEVLKEHFSSYD
jgi:hypothetical protein